MVYELLWIVEYLDHPSIAKVIPSKRVHSDTFTF